MLWKTYDLCITLLYLSPVRKTHWYSLSNEYVLWSCRVSVERVSDWASERMSKWANEQNNWSFKRVLGNEQIYRYFQPRLTSCAMHQLGAKIGFSRSGVGLIDRLTDRRIPSRREAQLFGEIRVLMMDDGSIRRPVRMRMRSWGVMMRKATRGRRN